MSRLRERGNGLLEMIVFLPLAMLLMFGLTDGAFAYLERARVADSLREALRSQGVLAGVEQVLVLNQNLAVEIDYEAAYKAAIRAADELGASVLQAKTGALGFNRLEFKASASVVVVDINPETGAVLRVSDVMTVVSESGNPAFNIQQSAPEYQYISQEDYLASLVEKESTARPSRFAVALEHEYSAGAAALPPRYLERAALLYGEATLLTQAINPVLTESVLGSMFAVQEQVVVPLKKVF